ncbi:MAG: Fic family protein [archaeon]
MFIEIKIINNNKKYYLVHSFRQGKSVKKIRRYLGVNLTKEKLDKLRIIGEQQIIQRIDVFKRISDPLQEVLSIEEIQKIKELFNEKKFKIFHLSEEQWKRFSELFTYNTNAIEGSDLDLTEVKGILETDKWPKYKSKEDISEAYGVREAITFIRKTDEHISISLIKQIHAIIFKNSKSFAGKLRSKGVEVGVRDQNGNLVHRGAPSEKVTELLKELIKWYNKYKKKYPPILLASVVHNQFENIHPFEDGNGRIGRILMNNILIKHSLPPVDITLKKRQIYYQALQEYQNNHNIRPTIELLLEEYKELKKKLKI